MSALDAIAERASRGGPLTDADARAILETPDLITVGVLGDEARRRRHGARTTFVRVLEVHVDAPPAALPARVAAGELRIVGAPAALDQAIAALRAASSLAGDVAVTGFSLPEIQALADAAGRPLEEVCGRLRDAGLYGLAEVPLDSVKDPSAIAGARRAGLAVMRLTVHSLADDMRIETLARARELQRAIGGFRVFAPLPRSVSVAQPTTGYDDVKLIALARVFVDNIESIQVDWPLYGPKLAQVALTVGADDVDGVAAVDPGTLGTRRSPLEEIRTNIRAARLEPVERTARFETGESGDGGESRERSPQRQRR